MECKGKLTSASVDYLSNTVLLTFATNDYSGEIREFIDKCNKDTDLKIKAVKWHDKRSLKANGYFHKLCELLATARTLSGDVVKPYQVKNEMIAAYGQREYLQSGKAWVIKTQITLDEAMDLQDDTHLQFWRSDPNEEGVYWYYIMRGSHTYDTREMAALIEGTVSECKAYNIETLPPDELRRMIEQWQSS